MVIAGTLLLLFCAGLTLVVRQQMRWRAGCKAGAAKIFGQVSELYRGENEFRIASDTEFPLIDNAGYGRVRDALTAQGLRHLGSFENLTASRAHPEHRTFIDSYVSADGSFAAGTYRIQDYQIVDVGSELEDGRFLVTTNAEIDKLNPPPTVIKCTLPSDTTVDVLVARHLERMAALQAGEPTARIVRKVTLEDVIATSRLHSRMVSEYRRNLGFITEKEMLGFATRLDQEPTARQMWKEFQRLRERAGRLEPAAPGSPPAA